LHRPCSGGCGIAEFFFLFLGGDSQRCCWLAEKAHQSLDVLRSRWQEETAHAPLGAPETVRATVPALPEVTAVEIVLVPEVPCTPRPAPDHQS